MGLTGFIDVEIRITCSECGTEQESLRTSVHGAAIWFHECGWREGDTGALCPKCAPKNDDEEGPDS